MIVVGDQNAARNCNVDYLTSFAAYTLNIKQLRQQNKEIAQEIELGPEYPIVSNPDQVSEQEKWFYKKLFCNGIKAIPQYSEEKYRLDFAVFNGDRKLNIEVDGQQHLDWDGQRIMSDRIRNQRLIELGWDVMRFWVHEIRDDTDRCIKSVLKWYRF